MIASLHKSDLSNFDIQAVNLQGVDLSEAILPALAQMPLLGTFIAGRWHMLRVSGGKGNRMIKWWQCWVGAPPMAALVRHA